MNLTSATNFTDQQYSINTIITYILYMYQQYMLAIQYIRQQYNRSAKYYISNRVHQQYNRIHQQYNTSAIYCISNTLHYQYNTPPILYTANTSPHQYNTPPIHYTTNTIHHQYNTSAIQHLTDKNESKTSATQQQYETTHCPNMSFSCCSWQMGPKLATMKAEQGTPPLFDPPLAEACEVLQGGHRGIADHWTRKHRAGCHRH